TMKLGIDYQRISVLNPRLIYCSITGYGPSGPYKDEPAYDIVIQGLGGLMGITGEQGRPPVRIGVALSDIGGGMYAAIAILAALAARTRTGKGQFIDISLLDSTASWLTYMAANYFANGKNPERMGSAHPTIVPYQCFETQDGEFVTVAIGNDKLFQGFCQALDLKELPTDPRFLTNPNRVANRDALMPILERRFREKPRREWLGILTDAKMPAGPVYSMSEVFSDPQILHREMLVKTMHPKAGEISQIGIPMKFSETKPSIERPPPLLGEHTDQILTELLGYDKQRISALHERAIV
ncbi:MAG TPA: CaiB/BaiF CoA-transferase family protein, partial [Terriglobales bacterium]|nr:CaiB/BaiF CoA-transferase family protein [Terriglobales bacterium]